MRPPQKKKVVLKLKHEQSRVKYSHQTLLLGLILDPLLHWCLLQYLMLSYARSIAILAGAVEHQVAWTMEHRGQS
jgi:hypothetical protein